MLGWICWQEGAKPRGEICAVAGVHFYRITVAPPRFFWQRRTLLRCIGDMRRRGVRSVMVQGEGDNVWLLQQGLMAVDVAPLRLALLPKLLDYAEKEWEIPVKSSTVRLCGKTAGRTVYQAAQVLAQRARYLKVSIETGQAELEDWLRRCYGLGTGGGRAVLRICVGVENGSALPALHFGENCAARQSLQLSYDALPWADEQLLSALFQAEKLSIDAITIKSVGFRA